MTGSSAGGDRHGLGASPCLSLLVTRDAYANQVFALAETACRKGIGLTVHLTGPGVLLYRKKNFTFLRRTCRVMICRESAQVHDLLDLLQRRHPDLIFFCAELIRSFLAGGRRLVF